MPASALLAPFFPPASLNRQQAVTRTLLVFVVVLALMVVGLFYLVMRVSLWPHPERNEGGGGDR